MQSIGFCENSLKITLDNVCYRVIVITDEGKDKPITRRLHMETFITETFGIVPKEYDSLGKAEGQADYLLANYPGIEVNIYRRKGVYDYLVKTLKRS